MNGRTATLINKAAGARAWSGGNKDKILATLKRRWYASTRAQRTVLRRKLRNETGRR